MSKSGNFWRKIHGKITKKPTNFSWLIDKKLAGSGLPTFSEEFEWIMKQGVKSVLTMTEDPLPASWIQNIQYLHLPTEDLTAPDMEKIDQAVDFIQKRLEKKEPVMVHCAAGIGRTGVILACYLIKYENYSAKEATQNVRNKRPGSIQSETQEIAIRLYEKHVKK